MASTHKNPNSMKNLEKGKKTRFASGESAAKNGAKGGKKTGENNKKRKNMIEMAKALLDMPVAKTQSTMRNMMRAVGIDEEDMTYSTAVMVAMLVKAANGDQQAAKFVRDTAGYNPDEHLTIDADATITEKRDVVIVLPELEMDEDDE